MRDAQDLDYPPGSFEHGHPNGDFDRYGAVNAYYSAELNEIVFPAAVLQPPMLNVAADDAVNYGGIGGIIGHEISHKFDDSGSQYDGDGNLRQWFTAEDLEHFKARTQRSLRNTTATSRCRASTSTVR